MLSEWRNKNSQNEVAKKWVGGEKWTQSTQAAALESETKDKEGW